MPSQAHHRWRSSARAELDELIDAHRAVGGETRGRRYTTQQVNRAYVVLLASHFQRYCRDLHTECVDHIVAVMQPVNVRPLVRAEMVRDRKLDRGNGTPVNIGADFGRLRLPFWPTLQTIDPAAPSWSAELDSMNAWRNAIAHQDFDPTKLGGTMVLRLRRVRQWQAVCNRMVSATDRMLRGHLHSVVGHHPW